MKRLILIISLLALIIIPVNCSTESDTSNDGNGDTTPASWHSVTTFNGSADKTTDTFYIQGNKFRLTWTVTPDSEAVGFGVGGDLYCYIYPEGETVMYASSFMATDNMATESDTTYVQEGNGNYYLEVTTANVEFWEIVVESYY